MEHLHAYWRMEYICKKEKGNPFRDLSDENLDRERGVLGRSEASVLLLNRYPYTPGHLLVVPKRQVMDLEQLEAREREDFVQMILIGKHVLREALNPEGFNVGWNTGRAAGAGIVDHLHAHVVPRWQGDTNFMPIVSQTRILPQALETLWDTLRPLAQARLKA